MDQTITVSIKIPFENKRLAEIVFDVLRIDQEPKRNLIKKSIKLEESTLLIDFAGEGAKNIRVAVTAFFEAILLCCETLNEFGPSSTEAYSHY